MMRAMRMRMSEIGSNTHWTTQHHHVNPSVNLTDGRTPFCFKHLSDEEELGDSEHMYLCLSSSSWHLYEVVRDIRIYLDLLQKNLLMVGWTVDLANGSVCAHVCHVFAVLDFLIFAGGLLTLVPSSIASASIAAASFADAFSSFNAFLAFCCLKIRPFSNLGWINGHCLCASMPFFNFCRNSLRGDRGRALPTDRQTDTYSTRFMTCQDIHNKYTCNTFNLVHRDLMWGMGTDGGWFGRVEWYGGAEPSGY